MREFLRLLIALAALAFVSATVANSIGFPEQDRPGATVAVAHVHEVQAEASDSAARSFAEVQSAALALAGIACVAFMAGRRGRSR